MTPWEDSPMVGEDKQPTYWPIDLPCRLGVAIRAGLRVRTWHGYGWPFLSIYVGCAAGEWLSRGSLS